MIDARCCEEAIGPDRAQSPVVSGGSMYVERASARTTYALPAAPPPDVLIHPMLSFTAVVAARWRGLHSFHAGAFVVDGGAWAVVGEKGTGKSSVLAMLAQVGYDVIADDVVVLHDGNCLAGPRAIDLRTSAAALFPEAQSRGVIGTRERWRLPLGPVAPEVPLHGWLTFAWGPSAVTAVPALERLETLTRNLAIRLPPADLGGLLDLAALPMLRVARPCDLNQLTCSVGLLVDGVRSARAAGAPVSERQRA